MFSQHPIYNLLVLGVNKQQQQQQSPNNNQQNQQQQQQIKQIQQQPQQQSPKSSRYTIAATPTKINSGSSTTTPTNMMTLTQSQPSPAIANGANKESSGKSFFTTPIKTPGKLKKKQMEKEIQMLQDKIRIMERIRNDNDTDVERMKVTLIDTLSDNDRLQKKVTELEETITSLKKELDKGSYESWKGYCSLQDSPPGISTRYSKKRALGANTVVSPGNL
eukprot:gene2716-3371_t